MGRNFENINWYSNERYYHYHSAEFKKQRSVGDKGEEMVYQHFLQTGHDIRYSTPEEDSRQHIDLWIDGHSYDVKYKKRFYIELVNNWGKPGWIYTGAEYIIHVPQDSNEFYIFKRQDMVNWIQSHNLRQFNYGNATLIEITNASSLPFVTKYIFNQ